jgi:reverse gyrase
MALVEGNYKFKIGSIVPGHGKTYILVMTALWLANNTTKNVFIVMPDVLES